MENDFLKKKYDLHNSPEVKLASKRTETQTGEKVSQNPENQIQNYLDRLEKLALDPKHEQDRKNMGDKEGTERSRALSLLREMVMNKYVRPNKDKLAEGAAIVEERAARQLGINNAHYGEEQLAERGEIAVKDLEGSLDQWISYLSDLNEPYPVWFRYYAFRNILELGEYDKDKQEFPKRTAGTNRLFPDIDRGALARIEDIIECSKDLNKLERFRSAQREIQTPETELLTAEKAKVFSNLSFAKQYVESIKEAGEITPEMRAETRGKWIKYSQDSDPTALWASLQNKGTAWCTKGFATAETQLKGGDFYVYYTLDKQGGPKIPRIAIRMQNGNISETRGVADSKQNLEGNMTDIAEKKMSELPGKEKYQKTSADMKKMTTIYEKSFKEDKKTGEKTHLHPELSKEELIFLYEINTTIDGFGYQKDPRIEELKKGRNIKEDQLIIFECTKEQIAYNIDEINKDTKAYIGEWNPEIMKKFPEDIEYLYESFPERKILRRTIELKTKTPEEYTQELLSQGIKISNWAQDILNKIEPLKQKEEIDLVSFSVEQLGFQNGVTLKEIYDKAKEFGLELCPPQVGPELRLDYKDQPEGEYLRIAMEPITDRDDDPRLFNICRYDSESWLYDSSGRPKVFLRDGLLFVFRFRK